LSLNSFPFWGEVTVKEDVGTPLNIKAHC